MDKHTTMNEIRLVGKGNANIVISIGNDDILYRLSVRFKNLETNNEYTLKNWSFIQKEIIPIFGSYLCPVEVCDLTLSLKLTELYSHYVSLESIKSNSILCLKLPNLNPCLSTAQCLHSDHQTRLFYDDAQNTFIMEIKPKWLHNPLEYCRNCTHNKYKGRIINYCYRKLLHQNGQYIKEIFKNDSVPEEKLNIMNEYFSTENNILQKIYDEQLKIHQLVIESGAEEKIPLLMTLRDVTCFIKWQFLHSNSNSNDANKSNLNANVEALIVDVDLKTPEKKIYWEKMANILNSYTDKVYHQ